MYRRAFVNTKWYIAAGLLLTAVVFYLDCTIRHGYIIWLLYALPFFLIYFRHNKKLLIFYSLLFSVLAISGNFINPRAGIAASVAFLDRVLGIVVLWMATAVFNLIDALAEQRQREVVSRQREETLRITRDLAKFPEENPYPVLRISKEGILRYANKASSRLLSVWNCAVNHDVPKDIHAIVTECIAAGKDHEIEVNSGAVIYSLIFAPITGFGYVNVYGKDITDGKRAAKQIELQRKLLETVVANLPVGVGLYRGIDNVIELANHAFLAIAPGKDVVGRAYKEVWPGVYSHVGPLLEKVLETGEPYHANDEKFMFRRSPAGSLETGYFSWSLIRIRLPGEENWGVLNTVIDTTERKRVEEQLRRTHEELELKVAQRTAELARANTSLQETLQRQTQRAELLKLLGEMASRQQYLDAVADLLKEWTQCSNIGIRLLTKENKIPYMVTRGFPPEFVASECELCVGVDECFCTRIFSGQFKPQDRPVLTENHSAVLNNAVAFIQSLSESEKNDFRGVCIRSGYCSVAVIPLRYAQKVIGAIHLADLVPDKVSREMIAMIESLTPLIGEGVYKLSLLDRIRNDHEMMERLFSSTNFLLAYLDTRFNFIEVNKTYADAGGYPREYFAGRNHFELYPHAENEQIFKNVVETGTPYVAYAKSFTYPDRPDRETTYWDWNLIPLKDSYGKVEGLLFSLVDVTKRKQAEDEIARMQKQLNDSRRLADIGIMAATMAHELRSPLAAIRLAAYNIKRKNTDEMLNKHLENINKKVHESDHIIQNLLAFSRIKRPQFGQFTLHAVVKECADTAALKYQNWEAEIREYYQCREDIIVRADAVQISMLLSNILDNAFQALPDKKGQVDISMYQKNAEDIVVSVRDTGVGIDQANLQKIFEPFFTTKSRGTGLGLAICKQIADLHDGKMDIESAPGKGTTIFITLPILVDASNQRKTTHTYLPQ